MESAPDLERSLTRLLNGVRIEDSLMFLNKVLATSRGESEDPATQFVLSSLGRSVPSFVIHLIVKYLLKCGRRYTSAALDLHNFPAVFDIAFRLAIADPLRNSTDDAVHAALIRIMSQQMERHIIAQSFGLAIGLFEDVGAIGGFKPIDLRQEVESAINMPPELFMRIGQAAMGATCGRHHNFPLRGTLTLDWLKKATADIPSVPWEAKWADFARAASCDPVSFNQLAERPLESDDFIGYDFNQLRRRPVIQIAAARYIAVDPWLLVDRLSWGIFYDVFEKYRRNNEINVFMERFGHAFERLVDNLLKSALAQESLWRESESELARPYLASKSQGCVADLAFRSTSHPVLIECAALRPSLQFCSMARESDLEKAAGRFAEELRQNFSQLSSIQKGEWTAELLSPGAWSCLLVTYGRFETANSAPFRRRIDTAVAKNGITPSPYVILSLEELDCVVSLVERGKDFGRMILEMASEPSYDVVARYSKELTKNAVSTFAKNRNARMFNFLPST